MECKNCQNELVVNEKVAIEGLYHTHIIKCSVCNYREIKLVDIRKDKEIGDGSSTNSHR